MNTIYIQIFLILISINAFVIKTFRLTQNILRPIKTESVIIIDGKLN